MSTLFARHEFQGQPGNLPYIHAMIKVNWDVLSHEDKIFVNNCIRASVLDIIKGEEINRLIDESLIKMSSEVRNIINLAKSYLINVIQDVWLWLVKIILFAACQTI